MQSQNSIFCRKLTLGRYLRSPPFQSSALPASLSSSLLSSELQEDFMTSQKNFNPWKKRVQNPSGYKAVLKPEKKDDRQEDFNYHLRAENMMHI